MKEFRWVAIPLLALMLLGSLGACRWLWDPMHHDPSPSVPLPPPPFQGTRIETVHLHQGHLMQMVMYFNDRVVSADDSGGVALWDDHTRKPDHTWHVDKASSVCLYSDGVSTQAAVNDADNHIALLNPSTGQTLKVLKVVSKGPLCWACSGPWLCYADDAVLGVVEVQTGKVLQRLRGHEGPINAIAVGQASGVQRVATASDDGTVRIWDLHTDSSKVEKRILSGHVGRVMAVAFDHATDRIVSGGEDGTARVWFGTTGAAGTVLRGHTRPVRSVAFSLDGNRIATGSNDRTAKVWDSDTATQLHSLAAGDGPVVGVFFSSDGGSLFTADMDGTIGVWQ